MEGLRGIISTIPITPVPEQAVPITEIERPVQVVHTKDGDKAIWAIVSDFTTIETIKMTQVCISAFEKLGKHETATRLKEVLSSSEELK